MSTLTKLMFLQDTEPMAHAPVRLQGDEAAPWQTDEEGRLEVILDEGSYIFEVEHDERWISQEVNTSSRDSLLIVNVADIYETPAPSQPRAVSPPSMARCGSNTPAPAASTG